jgi:predicted PurR-regulated permease PerM
MKEARPFNISISTSTLIKVVAVVAVVFLLYMIADIVTIIFVSLIFASAIEPMVESLEKLKIHRSLAIILIYLALFIIIGLTIYLIIPPIINESKSLGNDLPRYANQISQFFFKIQNYTERNNWPFDVKDAFNGLASALQSASQNLIGTISNLFGGLFSFFLILVMTFYMTMEEGSFKKSIKLFLPNKKQKHVSEMVDNIQQKIGWWFRGQITLCFIIFLMTYISLSIFGVKYALVLAIIAGFFEIIPYLGPTLSAVPAVFITFVQSPLLALFVLLVYIIIQSVENNILVPKVMQRAVGLDPIISIAALMIGFKLGGVIGAIISIPVATAIGVIIKDLFLNKKTNN